ncbi:MAG: DUF3784 domain-containing protein [Clostridia bacterium]|nr:DUF3784 domain-containing protein [Clostridia bacterium]
MNDLFYGSVWGIWVAIAIFAVLSAILLSGRGSFLIAGFNTASEEKKQQYDAKKLSRAYGVGMTAITVVLIVAAVCRERLPESSSNIWGGIILAVAVITIFCGNKFAKK